MRSLPAFPSFPALIRTLLLLCVATFLAACGTTDKYDETSGWSANKLYSESKDAQGEGNWEKAAKYLEKLEARFPYGRFAQQAQLELGYVYWKGNEPGSALAA
ncbi:MAG: outer membrane protein assembly factor BamD, partial [Azonexus sp.]|nr:outer membrane protein assembly factor BamD [Azonexus sp.]